MNKTTEPSFGHWIALGSTTTREHWDTESSHNHPMFGGGLGWFYTRLAGLQPSDSQTGYRQIIIKPMPVSDLTFARYYTQTVYGKAGIDWKQGPSFEMKVSVPVGSTAIVYIPTETGKTISEKSQSITNRKDIELLRPEAGYQLVKIGSGDYEFTVK